jgi:hypothetical protein
MNIYRIPVIGKRLRRERINALVEELSDLEGGMRDVAAALIELTDKGDDLHVEVVRLIQALDG